MNLPPKKLNRPRHGSLSLSSFRLPPSPRSGIALVITLIMLSVTLIMAVAFLAISNRERGSVTNATDSNHARLAADSALAYAEAQIAASIQSTTNPYNFGLFVSTNFINRYGFTETIADPTNVNYDYIAGANVPGPAGALSLDDFVQNIANLKYLPRAPVFVPYQNGSGYDFRYYLDLNRNGLFDDTGNVTNWQFISGSLVTNGTVPQIGDPQWIGVLEHPDAPHGPANRFIARYCYIAVPVGNTLDINAIYNDARYPAANMNPSSGDGYFRNEGVGSWELNLAAFLTDLNTNEWDYASDPYNYRESGVGSPTGPTFNTGAGFEDALGILSYRYNTNVIHQQNVTQYASNGTPSFNQAFNNIDEFSVGPLMTNNFLPPVTYSISTPWAGSDNTNHYFSVSDYFNSNILRQAGTPLATEVLSDRLLHAGSTTYATSLGQQVPTYDRYTFYRLLSQMGSDSEPEYGKINLNYDNTDANGNVVPGAETNFIPWNRLKFFTVAADRLLRTYTTNWFNASAATINYGFGATAYSPHYYFTNEFGATNVVGGSQMYTGPFGITNIPVFINGRFVYSSAVNRLLQLAANIYDASTNSFYPSVFRPVFARDNLSSNIFIVGYTNVEYVSGTGDPLLALPVDVSALASGIYPVSGSGFTRGLNNINVYGVPWIIGAKKGLPSFNELYVQSTMGVNRKMQVTLPAENHTTQNSTNKLYTMGITNIVGMTFWNSYYSNYFGVEAPAAPNHITVYFEDTIRSVVTNAIVANSGTAVIYSTTNYLSYWPGSGWTAPGSISPFSQGPYSPFVSFVFTNYFLTAAAYEPSSQTVGTFVDLNLNPNWYTNSPDYVFPQIGFLNSNYSQAYVLDGTGVKQHVVDYVQFSGPNSQTSSTNLNDPASSGMWSVNPYGRATAAPPTYGEGDQIFYSMGLGGAKVPPSEQWGNPDMVEQQVIFSAYVQGKNNYTYQGVTQPIPQNAHQAPYTPQRLMTFSTDWLANDPMVHYLAADLNYLGGPAVTNIQDQGVGSVPQPPAFNQVRPRYQPWGIINQMGSGTLQAAGYNVDLNSNNFAYKDPLVLWSDGWQFPTNLYPSVGWLGRVHRGTPWQTIFLKSTNLMSLSNYVESTSSKSGRSGFQTWQVWTGNNSNLFDATNTFPVSDRLLFDLFTAAPNDDATMGLLSVNQPHLAAWSAVFSGLPVFTNYYSPPAIFQPAGIQGTNYVPGNGSSYLGYIWNSIQQTRANTNLNPMQVFTHAGDILATPALSDASPFLRGLTPSEQMYEWLPQETLGLMKLGQPRYVIYCYGQALKPAPNGIMTGGNYPLMCTNYQIIAETAERAVVEIENAGTPNPRVVVKNINPLPPDQ